MENKENNKCKKSATDNQWVTTGQKQETDKRERKDGPGGEDADK